MSAQALSSQKGSPDTTLNCLRSLLVIVTQSTTMKTSQRSTVFGGLIVQGGVTTGILNALVAESLPGPGSVFLSMNLNFPKAVFVGDIMTGRMVVTCVRTDNPICNLEVSVTNQHGQLCLTGTATTYTVPLPLAENIRPF